LVHKAVRSRWPTWFAYVEEPPVTATEEDLPAWAGLRDLDDQALCLAWRNTEVALRASRAAAHRLRLARLREAILDELQRRSPEGFDAWLARSALAPGDPLPFVRRPRP
jgi:hypothetical protein